MDLTPPSAQLMTPLLLILAKKKVRWSMLHMEMKLQCSMPKGKIYVVQQALNGRRRVLEVGLSTAYAYF